MTRLNEYINAVLLNNPSAVAYNMMQLGVLQGDVQDPEMLKQSLVDHLSTQGDRGALTLVQALDVPVNYAGPAADQLSTYHAVKGNRAVLMSLVSEIVGDQDLSRPSNDDIRISSTALLQGLVILLLAVLTIFLIRKM